MGNSVKTWPKFERPRELLLEMGPDHVSDAGLVAVLLRSGTQGKDAVAFARELLNAFGGLRGLFSAGKSELEKIKGLGPAKIAQLMAAIEVSHRRLKEEVIGKDYVECEKDVIEYLSLSLRDLKEEVFKVLYLNKANCVVAVENLVKGTVDHAVIYPREVVKRALELGASSLIFVHNHPSGDRKPSNYDLELTKKLVLACQSVDITPLDHIIILPQGFISLKTEIMDLL